MLPDRRPPPLESGPVMTPIGRAAPIRTAAMSAAVLAISALAAPPAAARLGESVAECDVRYGEPVESIPSPAPGGDPEARVYRKNGFDITVAFHEGTAWWVRYAKQDLNQDQRSFLFKANGPDEEWRGPLDFIERRFWITDSREMHAVEYYHKGRRILELLTDACVRAHAAALEERLRYVGLDKANEIVEQKQPETGEDAAPRLPAGVDGL